MSGVEEAAAYAALEEAAAASAEAAAAEAAGAAGAGAAAYGGAGAAASGGAYGMGSSGLLGAGLSAEEIAALSQAQGGADLGAGAAAESGSGGSAFTSDYEKYANAMQQGVKGMGQAYNKLPPMIQSQATGMAIKGLLGGQEQGQTQNIRPPAGGGQAPGPTNPYANQTMPQVTPYAPTMGGPDDMEMKRRLMMLQMQRGR